MDWVWTDETKTLFHLDVAVIPGSSAPVDPVSQTTQSDCIDDRRRLVID